MEGIGVIIDETASSVVCIPGVFHGGAYRYQNQSTAKLGPSAYVVAPVEIPLVL